MNSADGTTVCKNQLVDFRFGIGKTNDKSKMTALTRKAKEHVDFTLLDIEEKYKRHTYKMPEIINY